MFVHACSTAVNSAKVPTHWIVMKTSVNALLKSELLMSGNGL